MKKPLDKAKMNAEVLERASASAFHAIAGINSIARDASDPNSAEALNQLENLRDRLNFLMAYFGVR